MGIYRFWGFRPIRRLTVNCFKRSFVWDQQVDIRLGYQRITEKHPILKVLKLLEVDRVACIADLLEGGIIIFWH